MAKVYGVDRTIRELKQVEPQAVNNLRKDLRSAAEPIALSIKAGLPVSAPISGMRHRGRTAYNSSAIKATPRTNFSKRAAARGYSLVSIWVGGKKGTVGAAGLQIADMSGRRGKVRSSGRTRTYTRNGMEMTHAIRGQARGLYKELPGRASRFVWKQAEGKTQQIEREILVSLEKTTRQANKNLVVKP
jgi:hypothetical protein